MYTWLNMTITLKCFKNLKNNNELDYNRHEQ